VTIGWHLVALVSLELEGNPRRGLGERARIAEFRVLAEMSVPVSVSASRPSKGLKGNVEPGRSSMSRTPGGAEIRLPSHEEAISAVTIFDGQGNVVRIVPATEFRRGPIIRRHPIARRPRDHRSLVPSS